MSKIGKNIFPKSPYGPKRVSVAEGRDPTLSLRLTSMGSWGELGGDPNTRSLPSLKVEQTARLFWNED